MSESKPKHHGIPDSDEQVLSTLNLDGSRRWIRPKVFRGRYWKARFALAWGLIALFTALPYVSIGGKPAVLLDITRRQFTLFGTTFLPTDTFFLMLLLVGLVVTIFLLTAIFGRVWCGWACPQTVYMEFVYRPIEQLLEGGRAGQLKMDRDGGGLRRALKYPIFLLVSAFLAHTFLAYFVGVDQLLKWVMGSPAQHPIAFAVMAFTTALMFFDFAYFREQTCLVACPYGRLQSVLLDRKSVIVGYDQRRGEPRGKATRRQREGEASFGDCVDCGYCVASCPTGIDIRQGLQMECVHCTQCIDACDSVMATVGKPLGLIRYGSQESFSGKKQRILRPRVIFYPAILLVVFGLLGFSLAKRETADVTLLRGLGTPYSELDSGIVSNQIRVKIVNRSNAPQSYTIELVGVEGAELVAPENPLGVQPNKAVSTTIFVNLPRDRFVDGKLAAKLRIHDGEAFDRTLDYRLLGPYGGAAAPRGGATGE